MHSSTFAHTNSPLASARNDDDGGGSTGAGGGSSGNGETGGEADDDGDEDEEEMGNGHDFGAEETWVRLTTTEYCDLDQHLEQLDSVLELSSFCIIEPVTLGFFPYIGADSSGTGNDVVPNAETGDSEVRDMISKLAKESIAIHRSVAKCLEKICNCDHEPARRPINVTAVDHTRQWACSRCTSYLSSEQKIISGQNPIIGKYIQQVMLDGRRTPQFTKFMAGVTRKIVNRRVQSVKKYLQALGRKLHKSCIEYWKRSAAVVGTQVDSSLNGGISNDHNSLYFFPGCTQVRSGIDFDRVDKQKCTKNYFKGSSTVPSFLTVQCPCYHPKLLGFVILKESESISAALSSVMTHFPVPPRRVWYDNACNSFNCAIIMVPWLLRWTTFMVDRFHFTGHTCSNSFNRTMQPGLDDERSNAAESLNYVIDKGASHIGYLKGSNVIHFMRMLFANINAVSHARDTFRRDDLEDEDIMAHVRSTFSCACHFCEPGARSHNFRDGVLVFSSSNVEESITSI